MAENRVVLYDEFGREMKPRPRLAGSGGRMGALSGGDNFFGGPPYDAADIYGQHMAAWSPMLWSPDAELNMYRDRIVSRVRDMVRNDGWASGAVTKILDSAVGATLRPIPKPDYRQLQQYTGLSTFDHTWAKEFARALTGYWKRWAYDQGHWCDCTRNMNFTQLMRVAFRHKLVDGDALAIMRWFPDQVGLGRARYATAMQLVDPDRLSNPYLVFDQRYMRGGIQIDDRGRAVGYHIRRAHQSDWFTAEQSMTWDLVPRETPWGRPIVVHDFDSDRAGTHRGGAGIFAPVLQRLKMLIKYDGVELDSAIINSIFAAYIESPFDHELVAEAVDDGGRLNFYQAQRAAFHGLNKMVIGSSRIPILFPGEKIDTVNATRPASNFQAFESAVLRNFASGVGISPMEASNNWSDTNYSSSRGALLTSWKTLSRRRDEFAHNFAGQVRSAWMEECMEVEDLPLPAGAPSYVECRQAYSHARWMGPGRGWIDPVAEKQGAIMGMDGALSTLEDECAEQGLEYEEVLEQRRYELELFDEYEIPRPQWAGQLVGGADDDGKRRPIAGKNKPEKPSAPPPQARVDADLVARIAVAIAREMS